MAVYDYYCNNCDYGFEKSLKISERDQPLSEPCPECGTIGEVIKTVTRMNIGDPARLGVTKPKNGIREVFQKIGATVPGSNLGLKA
jgi:putative FmdB family regulatory protein